MRRSLRSAACSRHLAPEPYEEFLIIKENLEDYEDLKDLREAKAAEGDAPTTRLSDIRAELLAD